MNSEERLISFSHLNVAWMLSKNPFLLKGVELTDLDLEGSFDILTLCGAWQGSFSPTLKHFVFPWIYFKLLLCILPAMRSAIAFPTEKSKNIFLLKNLIPFFLHTPYPDLNNIPILPQVCVHLCLPLVFHVPVTGPTLLLAKPLGEWSLGTCWARARSLSFEVMLSLAHWHFEGLSQPSGNSTTHLPHLLQYFPIFHSFKFLFYPLH